MKKIVRLIALFVLVLFAFSVPAAVHARGVGSQVAIPPIDAQSLSFIVIAIISLLLDYAPGLAPRWDALPETSKQLIFVSLGVLVVTALFVSKCYGLIETNIVCSTSGVYDLFVKVIVVLATGYGFHKATRPSDEFKRATLKIE